MEKSPLIHVGRIQPHGRQITYLLLRKKGIDSFVWYEEQTDGTEKETPVHSISIQEAIVKAQHYWKHQAFRTVMCGFRYTLPERDEHGINALFFQMVASYASPNGQYLDADLGHPCFVQNASEEARRLARRLK